MIELFGGFVFLFVGISILLYLFFKRKTQKNINDAKGFIGGIGAIIFGLYLIFQ